MAPVGAPSHNGRHIGRRDRRRIEARCPAGRAAREDGRAVRPEREGRRTPSRSRRSTSRSRAFRGDRPRVAAASTSTTSGPRSASPSRSSATATTNSTGTTSAVPTPRIVWKVGEGVASGSRRRGGHPLQPGLLRGRRGPRPRPARPSQRSGAQTTWGSAQFTSAGATATAPPQNFLGGVLGLWADLLPPTAC